MNHCPYCKIDFEVERWAAKYQPKTVCMNCRNYADAKTADTVRHEMQLFKTYRWIPVNWEKWDAWRDDPWYLKEGNT